MRLACALLAIAAASGAQTRAAHPVPLTTYTDPASGVRFQYPSIWKRMEDASDYLGPAFSAPFGGSLDALKPRAQFLFSPGNNLYANTVLNSLDFSFFVVPAENVASCVARARAATGGDVVSAAVTVHGTNFTEISGASAGMCHEQASQIDVAFRAGQCLAFERDFNTHCFGVRDGDRQLTKREKQALQRHLDKVMSSVTLGR